MPIVGDVSKFAVEFELDKNSGSEWIFGRFCYWAHNQRLGDYDLGTSLRDVLFALESKILIYKYERFTPRFATKPAHALFKIIDETMYGDVQQTNSWENAAIDEQWARHIILPDVDVFENWKAFLVEDQTTARLISAVDPYVHIHEMTLEPRLVDEVLSLVQSQLNGLYERAKAAD